MTIGYDLYKIENSYIYLFLQYSKKKKIKILHMRSRNDMYVFYIPTYQRYLLRSFKHPLHYINTIGLFKYILFLSRQYLNILGLACFLISAIGCSYFIFDIEIIGTLPKVNESMNKQLKKEDIKTFSLLKNYESLNQVLSHLKTIYKNDVEYINVYQIGSVFHVEYTKRRQEEVKKDDFRNIYALYDGMIAYSDIDSGLLKVKKNDYVKKGDLLVENTIISTSGETKIIPVKGKIFAYTFREYSASINNIKQDQADAFYHLLLMIRAKLPTNAHIDKESVLQMTKTRSKIVLKMQYTLIEDIGIKGETNEGSY